jgi:hypothetical protein
MASFLSKMKRVAKSNTKLTLTPNPNPSKSPLIRGDFKTSPPPVRGDFKASPLIRGDRGGLASPLIRGD